MGTRRSDSTWAKTAAMNCVKKNSAKTRSDSAWTALGNCARVWVSNSSCCWMKRTELSVSVYYFARAGKRPGAGRCVKQASERIVSSSAWLGSAWLWIAEVRCAKSV
jgi:hypothetical protein